MPIPPLRTPPDSGWEHYEVWERVNSVFYSIPNYFETELVIKGINVTDIFAVGGVLSSVVETQVVNILNGLRNLWDPDNKFSKYAFVRQSQTFPDVLLRNLQSGEIIFGVELKSWYVLSKEGEPSFRYQVTPSACAVADLIVIIPWILSDVISGAPKLLRPYVELARYAAEYRNYHWQRSRIEQGKNSKIRKPPDSNCHPYPSSKKEASDEAEDDKGGNFGRIARSGILDEYIASIKDHDYLGIKIMHWITFLKAVTETRTDAEIQRRLSLLRDQIYNANAPSQHHQDLLEILDRLEGLWKALV